MTTANLLNLVQNVDVSALTDMTEIKVGGGTRRPLLPTGTAFVRFASYIEYGNHTQEFAGKKKDPALEFRLGFVVVGGTGKNLQGEKEAFVEGDFQPTISTFDTAQTQYEKSKAVAYFKAINVDRTATHFIQKLGALYTIQIGVGKNKKTGKDQQEINFANLQPAIDPVSGEPYTHLPELTPDQVQVFLWNKPEGVTEEQYKSMWDSIYIEGEWEAKVDAAGVVTAPKRSKNFLQEKCLRALDFAGSSLETLLSGSGADIPSLVANAVAADTESSIKDSPSLDEVPAETISTEVPEA